MFKHLCILQLCSLPIASIAQTDTTMHTIALEDVVIHNSIMKYGSFTSIDKHKQRMVFDNKKSTINNKFLPYAVSFNNPFIDNAIRLDSVYIKGSNIDEQYTSISLLLLKEGQVIDTIRLEKEKYHKRLNYYTTEMLNQLPQGHFLIVLYIENKDDYKKFSINTTKRNKPIRVAINKQGTYQSFKEADVFNIYPQLKLVYRISND